jgi:hypothetical protein
VKNALICGLLSFTCTSAIANVLQDESCKIALPSYGNLKEALALKGFSEATFNWQYQVNNKGPVLTSIMPVDNSELIDRKQFDLGKAELAAKLSFLRYSGVPELKVFNQDGSELPVKVNKIDTHMGSLEKKEVQLADTAPIRAVLYNVLEKAKLEKTEDRWYELSFVPVHRTLILETELFTIRSVAQEVLAGEDDIERTEKEALEVIAGYKSLKQLGNKIDAKDLNDIRFNLMNFKLAKKETEVSYKAKQEAAFPTCQIVKK